MSRRKQVKPIRVSDTGSMVLPPQPGVLDFSNGGANFHEENGTDNDVEPMDMHVAIISCVKCPETFPSEEALSEHMRTSHYEPKTTREDFPTAYHRLGSELQETVYLPNGHNNHKDESSKDNKESSSLSQAKPQPPQVQQQQQQQQQPSQSQSNSQLDTGLDLASKNDNRIFHQDAYCEICDREFCNKYFLKTHKANKHGVYENSPYSYGNNSLGFPNMPVPLPMAHPKETTLTTPTKITPSPPATPKVEAIIQSMIKSEVPKAPPPVTVLASSKQITETTSSSSKPATHPDMEDYCEICQKHFCNKYYLKKHKQDVHGIVPETPSSSSKRSRSNFDIPFTTSATSSPMILPHTIASMANMAGLPTMPNMPGVMVLNPFMPPVAIIQAQSLLPHQQLHPPPSLPQVSQPLQLSPRPDSQQSSNKTSSLSLLPTSQPENSRSQGILNADAYCELCHKEFCNKLFLKIHKASKHGVFTDDGIDIPPAFLHMTKDLPKDLKSENENKKSLPTLTPGVENYVTYCKPCNKEFSSKYSYKIHCMSVHGMLDGTTDRNNEPDISDVIAPRMDMPGSEGLLKVASEAQAATGNNNNSSSNNNANASTMFGNMIAAKLADRVVCDICNKELCNKYFLKAHKLKVHGIDIGLSESSEKKNEQSQQSLSKTNASLKSDMKDMPMFIPELFAQELLARAQNTKKIDLNVTPPSDKPTYEELMKLGIDPEAYCEICKKEFCSKYFLRTHKLNIHGIKSEKQEAEKEKPYPLLPMNMMPSLPMMPGFPFVPTSLANMPMLNTLPSVPTGSSLKMNPKDGYEKHTWRWKEPVNSSRVICDICNKEVCNKYFLRTHKLNKHGIAPSDKSLSPTVSGSPALSDCDTASNASSQPDQNTSDKSIYQSKPENLSMPRQLASSDKTQSKPADIKMKMEEELSNSSNNLSEICHLCDRRFKNSKWLKAHIMKDHASWPRNEAVDMRLPVKPPATGEFCPKPCEVCGETFTSEITMQLHLIQEHNAQVTLKTDDVQNGGSNSVSPKSEEDLDLRKRAAEDINEDEDYACVLCDYKTKWISNLESHEEKMHNILKDESAMYSCKFCPKSFPDKLLLSYHVEKYHADVNSSISGSPTRQDLKKFKCIMCNERFTSRVLCHKHFQDVHSKTKRNILTSNSMGATRPKLSCTSCTYSTRYPQLLRRHMERLHSKVNGTDITENEKASDNMEIFEDDGDMYEEMCEEDEEIDMKMNSSTYDAMSEYNTQVDENRMVNPRFSPITH